ncbi:MULTISPECIES: hypothetical protein [Arthrobacter]|uniref:CcmD family protein n=2 Tax=Arthrobacter TaxID=1663 RepID=A0ABU9KJD6_9MICC|nr:hypothetical protein [Arthrobacter sp. YJM1]MDP5226746.1 hypothetical protein [Arthrobacter sp. YJM1]
MNELVLTVVFGAIFLYLLYFTIRAGVRDGIKQARRDDRDADSVL